MSAHGNSPESLWTPATKKSNQENKRCVSTLQRHNVISGYRYQSLWNLNPAGSKFGNWEKGKRKTKRRKKKQESKIKEISRSNVRSKVYRGKKIYILLIISIKRVKKRSVNIHLSQSFACLKYLAFLSTLYNGMSVLLHLGKHWRKAC